MAVIEEIEIFYYKVNKFRLGPCLLSRHGKIEHLLNLSQMMNIKYIKLKPSHIENLMHRYFGHRLISNMVKILSQ